MTKATKGWPPKRRKEQAKRLRKRKPWKRSTGPKTDEGKKSASRNSLKHGLRSAEIRELRRLLRLQRLFLKGFPICHREEAEGRRDDPELKDKKVLDCFVATLLVMTGRG